MFVSFEMSNPIRLCAAAHNNSFPFFIFISRRHRLHVVIHSALNGIVRFTVCDVNYEKRKTYYSHTYQSLFIRSIVGLILCDVAMRCAMCL